MKAALRNFIFAISVLQIRLIITLQHLDRFIDPAKPLQIIYPYLYYSKINIGGSLRNIEIDANGIIIGCNTNDDIYTMPSVYSSWS